MPDVDEPLAYEEPLVLLETDQADEGVEPDPHAPPDEDEQEVK